ncbi:MAG: nucleotide sugar dehydrogenase [Candidatus Falkowbacteria bacterium]
MNNYKYDLCIIGGAGHVGLPLGIAFANAGVKVVLLDINEKFLEKINQGEMPFAEEEGEELLRQAQEKNTLFTSASPEVISQSKIILSVIGTPIDERLNPDLKGILQICKKYLPYFNNEQIFILRSTVYPGTTERIQKYFRDQEKDIKVAFCPERIAQGKSLIELKNLPQIISASDDDTAQTVAQLFQKITDKKTIIISPLEAELAKLFCNAWRYISFAAVNQFFMITQEHNLDFYNIHKAMTEDYPRNNGLPTPGFAAGPCLLKDTLQLFSFYNNNFTMGHNSMVINEGLPNYLIQHLKKQVGAEELKKKTIGILGMAFKANIDDKRESLSYKLKKYANFECDNVLCHDAHIDNPGFVPLGALLEKSDIIILATPHQEYQEINPQDYQDKIFIDIWNFFKK